MNVESTIDNFVWPNRYLLTVAGFWPFRPGVTTVYRIFAYLRMVLSVITICFLWVPEILTIIVYWGDISVLTECGCIAVTMGQLIFKLVYMAARHRGFCQIYENAKELWSITDDTQERENFEQLARQAKQFTIVFFLAGLANLVTFTTISIVVWVKNYLQANETSYSRSLPFEVWYGIDIQRTPNFEIAFLSQLWSMIGGVVGIVGFDTTMLTLILHICGQFKLIRARFQAIGDRISEGAYAKLHRADNITARGMKIEIGRCITHHRWVIRIAKRMNSLLGPVIFIQLMTSGFEICLCGYALMVGTENNNHAETIKFTIYVATMFLQLTMWCWPGELLIQESAAIGDVILYELPWYVLTTEQQRALGFVIFRTQNECQITALGFHVMSLSKLTEVFNTAASYFALLRSFTEKETQ